MSKDTKKLQIRQYLFPIKKNKNEVLLRPIDELNNEIKKLELDGGQLFQLGNAHSRLAKLHAETGNWKKEQSHYYYAAKNMAKYYEEYIKMGWEIECYAVDDMALFYRRSIEICLSHKMHSVAGMIMMEAANKMNSMGRTEQAANIFQDALNHQNLDSTRTTILYNLIDIAVAAKEFGKILMHSDHIWMLAMRTADSANYVENIIRDTETITVILLNFDISIEHSSRHKSLLDSFNLENPEEEIGLIDPSLTRTPDEERKHLRELLIAFKYGNRELAKSLIPSTPSAMIPSTESSQDESPFYSSTSLNLCRMIFKEKF